MRISKFALISMFALVPFPAHAAEQPAHVQQDVVAQACDDTELTKSVVITRGAKCHQDVAADHDLNSSYVEIAIEHVKDAAVPDHMAYGTEQEDYAE